MRVILGGVRGSWPIAQRNCVRYGGETTSILVEGRGGEHVLVDLGTGVRRLGARLAAAETCSALVLMTHYHLDHVIGLPSLPAIYRRGCRVEFAAPVRAGASVHSVLPRLLHDPFWPLQLDAMHATIRFTDLPAPASPEPLRHGGIEVRWAPVHHPAECTAYRLDEPATGASVLVATDVEWSRSTPAERDAFFRLAAEPGPPGLLLFDGHFTAGQYADYVDWGHSTWEEALAVGREARARRLLVVHHSPLHTDRELARIDRAVRAAWPAAAVAAEGAEIDPGLP